MRKQDRIQTIKGLIEASDAFLEKVHRFTRMDTAKTEIKFRGALGGVFLSWHQVVETFMTEDQALEAIEADAVAWREAQSDVQKAAALRVEEVERVQRLLAELKKDLTPAQLELALANYTEGIYNMAGQHALGQIGFDIKFKLKEPGIRRQLLARANMLSGEVAQDVFDGLVDLLVREFYGRGASILSITKQIAEYFGGMAEWRAERIARTETLIAAEQSHRETWRRSGVAGKTWLTAEDELVRETHVALNNVTIKIDEKFSVGGYLADGPGDPSLPAKEVCNCRCATAPFVPTGTTLAPWAGGEEEAA